MRIGTITFHGSYNYGSVLQAYALQQFVLYLYPQSKYEIINFRPEVQKEMYWQTYPPVTLKTVVKGIMRLPYWNFLKRQAEAYEEFFVKYLNLTAEVTESELPQLSDKYDCFISGSDQIFNIRNRDFSLAYLLNFTDSPNKLSYAASMGPLAIDWGKYDKDKYVKYLRQFKFLSLREQHSKEMADYLLKTNTSEIHIDPTFLLTAEEWRKIQSKRNYNNGKYILIYCLEPSKRHLEIAKKLSKETKLPIVSTGYRNKYDYCNPFVKFYDAGPTDFLALIDNAEMVLTSSFHGTAFSIIYDKKFWVIDGMEDNRICNLLKLMELETNNIPVDQSKDFAKQQPQTAKAVNAYSVIMKERERSKEYFLRAFNSII